MEIGEVIRKYRKEKDMTQEEMARRLGVTAPAVNKWENGNSMPDIGLLAPIARLLDITVDTLLSFRESLTEEEICRIIQETDAKMRDASYEEAFRWAKGILERYPNCDSLAWQLALIFDVQRSFRNVPDAEQYDAYIRDCYVRALGSRDEDIRFHAEDALFGFYFRKGQYEEAEQYLSCYSKRNPERKRKQADIYSRTGRTKEAYCAYEELVLSGCSMLYLYLQNISRLALQEKDMEKARLTAKKQEALAALFEMGEYQEAIGGMDLAVAEQDADATMEIVEKLLAGVENIGTYSRSPLYGHMKFHEPRPEFLDEMRKNLVRLLRDEETFRYMAGDRRWQALMESLEPREADGKEEFTVLNV